MRYFHNHLIRINKQFNFQNLTPFKITEQMKTPCFFTFYHSLIYRGNSSSIESKLALFVSFPFY